MPVCVCCTCCKDSQILLCNPKPFYSWLEIKGIHPVGSIRPIQCTNVLAAEEQTYGSHFPYTKHGWVKSHLGKGFFDLQEPEWFRKKEYGPAALFLKCQWLWAKGNEILTFFSVLKEIFSGRLLFKLLVKVHVVAIRVLFYFTIFLMNVKVVFHSKKTRKRFYWTYRWQAVYKKMIGKNL